MRNRIFRWTVALTLAFAAWAAVTLYLLHHERQSLQAQRVTLYREAPCSKPWMTARDERAVCAMEAAARDWAQRNPGKVKR